MTGYSSRKSARVQLAAALALGVSMASQANAAVSLITPGSVSVDVGTEFFPATNLVNDSGLSTAADLNNFTTVTHAAASSTTAWTTDAPGGGGSDYYSTGPSPVFTFDLGGTFDVSELVVWGYGFSEPNNNEAKTFNVEFSTDGVSFGNLTTVTHQRTHTEVESLALGGSFEASHVRVTVTDNHFGTAGTNGGDRVGIGEVKFIGTTTDVENISLGKSYSYTRLPQFDGGTFYFDDAHVQATGVFDTGDLTDGLTFSGTPTIPNPSTIVGWGGNSADLDTEIIIDLEGEFDVDGVKIGTHLWSQFRNGAPDDVQVLFSDDGITFGQPVMATFGAPFTDGHHDLWVSTPNVRASFVKLVFDGGAVLRGPVNKWMLDEISVLGTVAVPEPATAGLGLLGLTALIARRRRR